MRDAQAHEVAGREGRLGVCRPQVRMLVVQLGHLAAEPAGAPGARRAAAPAARRRSWRRGSRRRAGRARARGGQHLRPQLTRAAASARPRRPAGGGDAAVVPWSAVTYAPLRRITVLPAVPPPSTRGSPRRSTRYRRPCDELFARGELAAAGPVLRALCFRQGLGQAPQPAAKGGDQPSASAWLPAPTRATFVPATPATRSVSVAAAAFATSSAWASVRQPVRRRRDRSPPGHQACARRVMARERPAHG